MEAPKGLILAGRPVDDELSLIGGGRAPHAIPVANKSLLAHGLELIRDTGIDEVAVVVSAATSDDVRALAETDRPSGLAIEYIECDDPPTLPEALVAARNFLGDSPFVAHVGDSVLLQPLGPLLESCEAEGVDALLLTREASPSQRRDASFIGRRPLRLVDALPVPPAEQALAGVYVFSPKIVSAATEAVQAVARRATVADMLAALTSRGGRLEVRAAGPSWKYTGLVDELLSANRMVLDELEPAVADGVDLSSARVEGRVAIGAGAVLERTTVRGPAVIGAGAVLVDAFVGPYSAIGQNVRIEGAEVEYSIVLPGATIRHPGPRLEASLVGQDATVSRDFALPSALRLRVGRRSNVSLS